MMFPDPWPKSRHEGRRIYAAPLLDALIRVLRVGGTFTLATDHPLVDTLAREGLAHFSGTFLPADQGPWPATKYERKWQRLGRNIMRLVWRKDAHHAVKPAYGWEEESIMPHLRLPGKALEHSPDLARGQVVRLRHGIMKILGVYRNEKDWLISTLVVDPPLGIRQPIHYLLHPYQGMALLHLEHPAEVLITPAVKEGLRWLAERFSP
jgi:tRNA (guanine-N7-)-methyltransferase